MPYYVNRIQNGNELYHHGILGQKWGVRRFQNADGSRTSAGKQRYAAKIEKYADKAAKYREKADNAKTNIGQTIALDRSYRARYKAATARAVSKEDTLAGKVKQRFGDAANARRHGIAALRDEEVATRSSNWRQIRRRETSAYNNTQMAKTFDKRSKMKTSEKIGRELALDLLVSPVAGHLVSYGDTKMKTLAGRKTSYGMEMVGYLLTAGTLNAVMDVGYGIGNYKEVSATRSRRKEQAKANKEARKAKNSGE